MRWRLITAGLLLLAPLSASAQTYEWKDDQGRTHTATDFDRVPVAAVPRTLCRCRVVKVLTGDRLEVSGGLEIRLISVDAPDRVTARDPVLPERSRRHLEDLVRDAPVTLRFDENYKNHEFHTLAWVYAGDVLVNEAMIRSGKARLAIIPPNVRHGTKLIAAQDEARTARRGVWTKPPPVARDRGEWRNGFALGLYSRDDAHDYGGFLREMAALGTTHVLLVTPWFMHNHRAVTIRPEAGRSCSLGAVARVVRQARQLGMKTALMPIVLLRKPGKNRWRGNIAPRDVVDWFHSYNEYILPFADVAREAGVDLFLIGSEFSSLERYSEAWRAVAGNVRRRFPGLLSYSANWDHLEHVRWWDAVDMAGMTGYHTLTGVKDPTVSALTAAWSRIRDRLMKLQERIGKPIFFSEIGYASLDGINMNPWDYVTPEKIDLGEQADCYRAWVEAWSPLRGRGAFRGAYFYTWWRNGDETDDRQYTVRGKPAEEVIRRYFRAK